MMRHMIKGKAFNTYKARGRSGDTLLNSEEGFEFWGVIFSFMLKEEEKISMVSPELDKQSSKVSAYFLNSASLPFIKP